MKIINILNLSAVVFCACTANTVFADNHTGGFWPKVDLDIAFIGDDNINKSPWANQISEDKFLDTRLTGAYIQSLDRFNSLRYFGTLSIQEFGLFDGLNQTAFKLGANWDFQFGSSFSTPSYQLSLAVEQADYETDIRDNTNVTLNGSMVLRITDTVTSTLGIEFKNSDAETLVFDTKESRFFANFDLIYNDNLTIYTTFSYIDGDIVPTARQSLSIVNATTSVNGVKVIEADNAFGGIAHGALAYRLQAKTQVLNLGFNYAIDEKNAIDASVMTINSEAEGNISYDRLIGRISYLFRF